MERTYSNLFFWTQNQLVGPQGSVLGKTGLFWFSKGAWCCLGRLVPFGFMQGHFGLFWANLALF